MVHPSVARSVIWLPPATSKAPFIVIPSVVNDFQFRVLRQNRRVVAGTEDRKDDGRRQAVRMHIPGGGR